jgi:RHS repeat-associated protein
VAILSTTTALDVDEELMNHAYDGDGDVTQEDDNVQPTAQVAGTAAPQTQSFTEHFQRDVLTGWEDSAGSRSLTVSTDGRRSTEGGPEGAYQYLYASTSLGNQRLLSKSNGSFNFSGEMSFTYDLKGQISTVDFGANGSTDITLGYNVLGSVATATNSAGLYTYSRDHEMRRVLTQGPISFMWTRWRYGLGRSPLEQANSLSKTEYIYLQGAPIAAVASTSLITSGKLYFLYPDRMGTPRKAQRAGTATVETRLVMDAWGKGFVVVDAGSSPQPFLDLRRHGQVQDPETTFVENGYRTLIPEVGQYTSPEPKHRQTIVRGMYGPQTYSFVAGRPLRNTDPDGRAMTLCDPWTQLFGRCGASVAGASPLAPLGAVITATAADIDGAAISAYILLRLASMQSASSSRDARERSIVLWGPVPLPFPAAAPDTCESDDECITGAEPCVAVGTVVAPGGGRDGYCIYHCPCQQIECFGAQENSVTAILGALIPTIGPSNFGDCPDEVSFGDPYLTCY